MHGDSDSDSEKSQNNDSKKKILSCCFLRPVANFDSMDVHVTSIMGQHAVYDRSGVDACAKHDILRRICFPWIAEFVRCAGSLRLCIKRYTCAV